MDETKKIQKISDPIRRLNAYIDWLQKELEKLKKGNEELRKLVIK